MAPVEGAQFGDERLLIAQGAEARVYAGELNGRRSVVKERFSKVYRHPDIDYRLRSTRMGAEARMLMKARQAGVCTPSIYFVDMTLCALHLEWIDGPTARRFILERGSSTGDGWSDDVRALARVIGRSVGRLHDLDISHGDLTTSNMILRDGSTEQFVLIDFGLSTTTTSVKDKAVDLYVCEKAFLSTHPHSEALFELVLSAYRATAKSGAEVVKHLDKVRARGRKKICLG